jgi:quercetin dioxygenase-like cupin family protein
MNRVVVGLAAGSLALAAVARQEAARAAADEGKPAPMMVSFTDLKWTEVPQRKGMQMSVLSGDPNTAEYTQVRRVPAGTDNPPHAHSSQITNVVISGVWYTGVDARSARDFGAGSVVMMPANWVHVSGCRAGSECVFYQDGKGKFDFKPATPASPGR